MKNDLLVVNNLKKNFNGFQALKGVTFSLKKGERIGLIGANGAGKTTITEIIAGITKPTSGSIEYNFEYSQHPSEKIGMQFQQSVYPSGLTVKDMITFAIKLRKIDISKKEIDDLLNTFMMKEFYKKRASSLSGGQKQKLNILMSILHNPELVIFDELSTGLDVVARENIIKFTRDLVKRRNITSIFISHHMQEVKELCDRIIVLSNGKIINEVNIKDIETDMTLNEFMRQMINDGSKKEKQSKKVSPTKNITIKKGGK